MTPHPRILVCHPGRQHSHRLAMALARCGMLARYVTGAPAHADAVPAWQRPLLRAKLATGSLDIDPALVKQVLVAPLVRRLASRIGSASAAADWGHRGEAWFDRIAAREVRRTEPDLVVCYENAALETFREARRLGIATVLDAASFHHTWQDRHYDPVETNEVHRRICERKDAEVSLADHVLTVSSLARDSYVEAGVRPESVTAIPVGAELDAFRPRTGPREPGPVRFIYVGHVGRRKGMDLLLDAMAKLRSERVSAVVSSVGRLEPGFRIPNDCELRQLGWIAASELPNELVKHDVLVLPSRHDSFGMVVAEAMACGLPAIVSGNVGAKELVSPGENGAIVPADDSDALTEAMRWFSKNSTQLEPMRDSACAAAACYDWSVYERRVVERLQALTHRAAPA